MPNDWHRAPFGPRSDFDVRIALADQIDSSGRKVIDDRNADVLLNGGISFAWSVVLIACRPCHMEPMADLSTYRVIVRARTKPGAGYTYLICRPTAKAHSGRDGAACGPRAPEGGVPPPGPQGGYGLTRDHHSPVSRPITMQASLTRDLQRVLRADKFAHFDTKDSVPSYVARLGQNTHPRP